MTDLAPASRREQLQAILADAARYPRVVIGGGHERRGCWASGAGDGLRTVLDSRGSSDHLPVWAVATLDD